MQENAQLDYRFKANEDRIARLELDNSKIIADQSGILQALAINNERMSAFKAQQELNNIKMEGKIDSLSKQLDNGIKTKLEKLASNWEMILPIIEADKEAKAEARKKGSLVNTAIEISIKTGIVGAIGTGFISLFLFLLKLYFKP